MKWWSQHKLECLLRQTDLETPFLAVCREDALQKGIVGYKNTGRLPRSEALDIYVRRLEYAQETGNVIPGFSELVHALRDATYSHVVVHLFSGRAHDYYVFTTPSSTQLLGGLVLDQEGRPG